MLRGLGVEQRGILAVLASKPEQWWRRAHIQQCAWGEQKPGRGMRLYSKRSRPMKNVCWWRGGKQLAEGNFSRALYSLERRGLVERDQRQYGGYPHWKITKAGLDYYGYVPNLPPHSRRRRTSSRMTLS